MNTQKYSTAVVPVHVQWYYTYWYNCTRSMIYSEMQIPCLSRTSSYSRTRILLEYYRSTTRRCFRIRNIIIRKSIQTVVCRILGFIAPAVAQSPD